MRSPSLSNVLFYGGALTVSFLILTFISPFNLTLFVQYYLSSRPDIVLMGLIVIVTFSYSLSYFMEYLAKRFEFLLKPYRNLFIVSSVVFYIISFVLMLGNTSYNIFSYVEMNNFIYTLLNFILLAPIIAYTSLFLVNIFASIKDNTIRTFGSGGLLASLFSMGCPTCGALLYSLIGLGAGLTLFPLKGLEIRLISLGLLVYASTKITPKLCKECLAPRRKNQFEIVSTRPLFDSITDKIILISFVIMIALIGFNQLQIQMINSSITSLSLAAFGRVSGVNLENVDVYKVSSTAMAIATVFPEIKSASSIDEIASILIPSGTPEYSEALGGITFDDIPNSLTYLSRWYFQLKDEVKNNDPETWQRYLKLAAAPRGISCEFCCGVGPQGITSDGNLRCGCSHNIALQALTLGLMKYTDYSDAEILREVLRWKAAFFPRGMVNLAAQTIGQDPSQLGSLPGMVGGC